MTGSLRLRCRWDRPQEKFASFAAAWLRTAPVTFLVDQIAGVGRDQIAPTLMRLVVDTNVFVSAALKEVSWPATALRWIAHYGGLLKSTDTETELLAVP